MDPSPLVFEQIPGIGPRIASYLWRLGYRDVRELCGQDPERMFERFCRMEGTHIDRCLLYVFRCAVYYASVDEHDPDLLQWWNWKTI